MTNCKISGSQPVSTFPSRSLFLSGIVHPSPNNNPTMQSQMFRATVRSLSQQVVKKKQKGVITMMLTDVGNFPLIAANSVGALAVIGFASRKSLFHPDVGISGENRFSNEVGNETPSRLESADQFRQQTRTFGRILQPISSPIVSLMTGRKQGGGDVEDKWSLSFLINTDVQAPLEATNHFDDDLFTHIEASEFAMNKADDKI